MYKDQASGSHPVAKGGISSLRRTIFLPKSENSP